MSQLIIFPAVPSAWDILAAEFAELALHFIRALLKCPLLRETQLLLSLELRLLYDQHLLLS